MAARYLGDGELRDMIDENVDGDLGNDPDYQPWDSEDDATSSESSKFEWHLIFWKKLMNVYQLWVGPFCLWLILSVGFDIIFAYIYFNKLCNAES